MPAYVANMVKVQDHCSTIRQPGLVLFKDIRAERMSLSH